MIDYFKIFQIEPNLDIDNESLEEKYLDLQLEFHPDLLIDKSEKEKKSAEIKVSNINNAFEILKNPLYRMIHLLEINNIFIDRIEPDPKLLMEIMEIKESLEDQQDQNQIDEIKNHLKQKKEKLYNKILNLANKKDFNNLAKEVIFFKYLNNINQ